MSKMLSKCPVLVKYKSVLLENERATMKAISLKQPWANMIADGEKTIETRTWPTNHRGELLICSSKKPDIDPAGCAVAVCRLVDCRPMTAAHAEAACCDVYPKAWAWFLEDVLRIDPFDVKGQLGLYDVDVTGKIDPLI